MKKILIIEDNNAMRQMVKDALLKAGFEVQEAENGYIGLQNLDQDNPPAIIITDIIMPEKDGLETIAELRSTNPQIYIIAISGGGSMDKTALLDMAQKMGAQQTLAKPFDPSALIDLVNNAPETLH